MHAERHHGEQEVVSRRVEGDIHRTTFRDLAARARRVAQALAALGITPGERVGTIAWNGYRHLELYYAVSGSGAVLHTINPRLHPDQIVYILDHAEDLVEAHDDQYEWPVFDENTASTLCYTSGTTGKMLKHELREQFRDYRLPTA